MAKGIIAKIKNIKHGSQGRSGVAQIGDSLEYITNSEKCDMKMDSFDASQLSREITYVVNDLKTIEGLYVGCRRISEVEHAVDEMMQVKEFYGKTDGRVAMHLMISVDAEESDIGNAGNLMYLAADLLAEIFPENQAVFAVHTNTDNLHIHLLINTVGLDGKKIHMDNEFIDAVFHPAINKLARRYGFTPNPEWEKERKDETLSIAERKIMLRSLIDVAIENSIDFEGFISYLRMNECTVNVGKFLSIKAPDMTKAIRTVQLGDNYSIDSIKARIKNRLEPFELEDAKNHVASVTGREMLSYTPNVIKKYQDMTEEEKKKAIHMIRLGRNPWLMKIQGNWQMRKASEELARYALVHEMIDAYSSSNSPEEAMEVIIEKQKELGGEIKALKANLRKYKPQIDIYLEMKRLMQKVYLYEKGGYEEYKDDFLQYQNLEKRLLDGYGKNILEVAAFYEDQSEKLLYAKAQKKELSEQYKTISYYVRKDLHRGIETDVNLFAAIGHSEAKNEAYLYGLLQTRKVFITADNEDVYLRVITTPALINGKSTVATTVTVLDKRGTVMDEFSSEGLDSKEFNQKIKDIRDQYHFKKCLVHKEEKTAVNELNTVARKKSR